MRDKKERPDPKVIQKRFVDLEQEAKTILEKREFDFRSVDGEDFYKLPPDSVEGWIVQVLSLLRIAFPEDNIYYQRFHDSSKEN